MYDYGMAGSKFPSPDGELVGKGAVVIEAKMIYDDRFRPLTGSLWEKGQYFLDLKRGCGVVSVP